MANNYMYLKCRHCLGEFLLAKRYVEGYFRAKKFDDEAFQAWLDKHDFAKCFGGGGRQGVDQLDCYEISYESDPELDRKALGLSHAQAIKRMEEAEVRAKNLESGLDNLRTNFIMKLNAEKLKWIEEFKRDIGKTEVKP